MSQVQCKFYPSPPRFGVTLHKISDFWYDGVLRMVLRRRRQYCRSFQITAAFTWLSGGPVNCPDLAVLHASGGCPKHIPHSVPQDPRRHLEGRIATFILIQVLGIRSSLPPTKVHSIPSKLPRTALVCSRQQSKSDLNPICANPQPVEQKALELKPLTLL